MFYKFKLVNIITRTYIISTLYTKWNLKKIHGYQKEHPLLYYVFGVGSSYFGNCLEFIQDLFAVV